MQLAAKLSVLPKSKQLGVGYGSPRFVHFIKNNFHINFLLQRGFCSMATMSISSNLNDLSNYGNRMVTITVTASNQQFMRLANQTLSVPYNRLSQAIRNIHRSGSKVVNVSMISAAPIVGHSSTAAPEPQSKPEDNNPAAKKKKR
jgi:hypothetical protein